MVKISGLYEKKGYALRGNGICVNVHLENAHNRESETKAERTKVIRLLSFDRVDDKGLFGRLDSPDAVISVMLFFLFKLLRTTGISASKVIF